MINRLTLIAVFFTATLIFTTKAESIPTLEETTETEILTEAPDPAVLSEEEEISLLYEDFSSNNASVPSFVSFKNGLTGYNKLVDEGEIKNEILTIVDFSLKSTEKRMWILDMSNNKVLYHTYVAHGKNTGGDMATSFSNVENSFQSSLGFYVTAETYYGKNGLSLFIDGKEEGFNSNARQRYVVIHGSDYATPDFIARAGRLGRSLGCPAVPTELSKEIINLIKGNSALFIYHTNEDYAQNSTYLNPATA